MISESITDIYSFTNVEYVTMCQVLCWMLWMPGEAENIPLFICTASIYGVPVTRHTTAGKWNYFFAFMELMA